eukprot:GHRR01031106.1.p1 GENE.GHRR01031106.1~~GHRR01031106.1.p1  ORF type:complete len:197 (-),score=22.69 GHRR01031106.1:405-929(-)
MNKWVRESMPHITIRARDATTGLQPTFSKCIRILSSSQCMARLVLQRDKRMLCCLSINYYRYGNAGHHTWGETCVCTTPRTASKFAPGAQHCCRVVLHHRSFTCTASARSPSTTATAGANSSLKMPSSSQKSRQNKNSLLAVSASSLWTLRKMTWGKSVKAVGYLGITMRDLLY